MAPHLVETSANAASWQLAHMIDNRGRTIPRWFHGAQTLAFENSARPETHGKQRCGMWCWAASAQMVFNYNGADVQQEDFVKALFGDTRNSPANNLALIQSMIFYGRDRNQRPIQVQVSTVEPDANLLIQDLTAGHLFITGIYYPLHLRGASQGHVYVLTGVETLTDPDSGQVFIENVVLRDPERGKASRRTMPWNEFLSNRMWLVQTRVSVN